MSELFTLSLPWWQFVLRAIVVYVGVMVLVRLSGKRAVGQFTPFDLVLLILIGNAVQNGMNGGDDSLTGALILTISLIGLNYAVAWMSARSPHARRLIEGSPVELARDGKIHHGVLKQQLVSKSDFHEAMRQSGCAEVEHIKLAMLETNGHISIISDNSESGGSN